MRKRRTVIRLVFAAAWLIASATAVAASGADSAVLPISQEWHGDYPDREQLATVWSVFRPGEREPQIDFSARLVVFTRNVSYYNRTTIVRVLLKGDSVEILAAQTMSSLPIEDRLGMALAVIPRHGVNYIEAGSHRIPVRAPGGSPARQDPSNATYLIEGEPSTLRDGRSDAPVAPGSVAKAHISVYGDLIEGNIIGTKARRPVYNDGKGAPQQGGNRVLFPTGI